MAAAPSQSCPHASFPIPQPRISRSPVQWKWLRMGVQRPFWKHRLRSQTSCVLQCYLQNRKLCPIFATHILCLRVWWCRPAGAGHFSGRGGGCSDSDARKDSLPVTHKNKQTDPFAKIIRVGWPHQDYLFLEPSGIEDRVFPQRGGALAVRPALLPDLWQMISVL